jgi:hypothetical protein
MTRNRKLAVAIALLWATQVTWADDKPGTPPTPTLTPPASPATVQDTEDEEMQAEPDKGNHPKQITAEKLAKLQDKFVLPPISEVYEEAKNNEITGGWSKKITVQPQDFAAMAAPQRAFEVGKTLSNIAFIVLDSDNEDAPPPKSMVQLAYDAIMSLKPPAAINTDLQQLREQMEAGTLKGKELRQRVDVMLDQTIPNILKQEPSLRDAGTLVLASGLLRALYLGASTVAILPNPTREQLAMFRWGKGILNYLLTYFTQKADASFKDSTEVKNLVVALKKIQPLSNKKPEDITKADVGTTVEALERLFK